jgi:hypothetical protein
MSPSPAGQGITTVVFDWKTIGTDGEPVLNESVPV